jgi:hypothetical protein
MSLLLLPLLCPAAQAPLQLLRGVLWINQQQQQQLAAAAAAAALVPLLVVSLGGFVALLC